MISDQSLETQILTFLVPSDLHWVTATDGLRGIRKANTKDTRTPLLGAGSEPRTAHSLVEASPAAITSPSEGPAAGKDTSPSKHTESSSPPLPFIQQLCPHNIHT